MTPANARLVPYDSLSAAQGSLLRQLQVEPWQREACGTIDGALHMLLNRCAEAQAGWALLVGEQPAAFLMVMREPLTPDWIGPTAALMHSFQVDRRVQRQGLGRACLHALPAAVKTLWPDITELVLSVDPVNTAAIHLYQAEGWVDSGEAYRARVGYERKYVLRLTV